MEAFGKYKKGFYKRNVHGSIFNSDDQDTSVLIHKNGGLSMADNPCFDPGDDPAAAAPPARRASQPAPAAPAGPGGQCQPLLRLWSLVTVEPIVMAYYVTAALTALGVQNMLLYKACWPEGEPARGANVTCEGERASQRVVADINAWKPFVMHSLPVLCLAFAGSWSDRHGGRRKPLIIIPLVGSIVVDACLLLNAFFWELPPLVTALADALPYGLSGGSGVLNIGVMGYIADVTSHEARTARLGVVMAFVFLGSPIGLALGGALSEGAGLAGLFAVCGAVNSLALLYAVLCVRETGRKRSVAAPAQPGDAAAVSAPAACSAAAVAAPAGSFCDPAVVVRAVKVVGRPRGGYKRCSLIMLLCANPFIVGPLLGEASVLFLFVRVKFGWSPFEYGVFACFKMTTILIGTLVSMAILCHWLQIEDAKIGMLACTLQTIAYITYSNVSTGWAMYIVPLLEVMLGAGITVHKSIVSKLVPNSEMGQVTALLSMNEAIVPLIVHPMYNKLYQHTLDTMPGAFYYLGASLAFPGAIIFSLVYFLNRKDSHKKDDAREKPPEKKLEKPPSIISSYTSSKSIDVV